MFALRMTFQVTSFPERFVVGALGFGASQWLNVNVLDMVSRSLAVLKRPVDLQPGHL